jgi:hypothetical protein
MRRSRHFAKWVWRSFEYKYRLLSCDVEARESEASRGHSQLNTAMLFNQNVISKKGEF